MTAAGLAALAPVLFNPRVDAAVLETARGASCREGLGFDMCDVAIVTNIGEGDHLGMAGIDTAEQLAEVKRTVVENVAPTGAAVLNAADFHDRGHGALLSRLGDLLRARSQAPAHRRSPRARRPRRGGVQRDGRAGRGKPGTAGDQLGCGATDPRRPDRLPSGQRAGCHRGLLVRGVSCE